MSVDPTYFEDMELFANEGNFESVILLNEGDPQFSLAGTSQRFGLDLLLNPASSQLEKDILKVFDWETIDNALETFRRIRYDSANSKILPYLFIEKGLGALSKVIDLDYSALEEAELFQQRRGTVWAIRKALEWTGVNLGSITDNDPGFFTINLADTFTDANKMQDVVTAIDIAKAFYTKVLAITNNDLGSGILVYDETRLDESFLDDIYGQNFPGLTEDIRVFLLIKLEETHIVALVDTIATVLASRILLKVGYSDAPTLYRRTRNQFYVVDDVSGDLEVDGFTYSQSLTPTNKLYIDFVIDERGLVDSQGVALGNMNSLNLVYNTTLNTPYEGKEFFEVTDIASETQLVNLNTSSVPRAGYIENEIKLVIEI